MRIYVKNYYHVDIHVVLGVMTLKNAPKRGTKMDVERNVEKLRNVATNVHYPVILVITLKNIYIFKITLYIIDFKISNKDLIRVI